MTLQEIISNLDTLSDDATVFAKSNNGEFQANSLAVLIKLSEAEEELPTKQIAQLKCPGYDCFMEIAVIKDFMGDLLAADPEMKIQDKTAHIIHYEKYDA